MSVRYCVITRVPNPATGGNLAMAWPIYREIEGMSEANDWRGRYEEVADAMFTLREPVFSVGEILIVDEEYGREYGYPGRKPSKWDVTAEYFGDVQDAIARSREVTA